MELTAALDATNRLYARIDRRRHGIQQLECYYTATGQGHPLKYMTPEWREQHAGRYKGFADNWMRTVVDAELERTGILDVTVRGNDAAGKQLWDEWLRNEGELGFQQASLTTLVARQSYALVWTDEDGRPLLTFEHPSTCEIEYDVSLRRRRKLALKTWADDDLEYATLYTPTELWKFQRKRGRVSSAGETQADVSRVTDPTGGWEQRQVDGEEWPLPNPMGVVPMIEIPNRPMLGHDPVSEIEPVIPLQDAINLMWAYLFVAADYASMEARVVLNAGAPMVPVFDGQGKKVGEKPLDVPALHNKRIAFYDSKDGKASIDSWSAAELKPFLETIDELVSHIAMQTRTPPHSLAAKVGMSNVSAEGLKASEIGLVQKVREYNAFAKPAVREIFRLLALASGMPDIARNSHLIQVREVDPEIRSEGQLVDALTKRRSMGYPFEWLLEKEGIAKPEIDRILAMRLEEANDPILGQALLKIEGAAPSAEELPDAGDGE